MSFFQKFRLNDLLFQFPLNFSLKSLSFNDKKDVFEFKNIEGKSAIMSDEELAKIQEFAKVENNATLFTNFFLGKYNSYS